MGGGEEGRGLGGGGVGTGISQRCGGISRQLCWKLLCLYWGRALRIGSFSVEFTVHVGTSRFNKA